MRWILKRDDGAYVRRPGGKHAYSWRLQDAQTWPTRESAQAEACGNEYAISVESEMS